VNWTAQPSEGIAAHWFKADSMSWSLMDAQRSDIPRTILGEGALIVSVGVGAHWRMVKVFGRPEK
jgi:hypothetical protein